jgi:hypothetical protein
VKYTPRFMNEFIGTIYQQVEYSTVHQVVLAFKFVHLNIKI